MNIYHQRKEKLQRALREIGCDGYIVDDKINLYYLTGFYLSAGKLLIHPSGAHLVVDNRYFEMCRKTSPFPVVLAEKDQSFFMQMARELQLVTSLGFNSEKTTYKQFLQMKEEAKKLRREKKVHLNLKGVENLVAGLRSIKDPGEIETLRQAAALGSQGFDYLCTLLKDGVTEEEIAIELEIFWKRKGGKSVAFDPIIAFGQNSCMPHHRAGNERLQLGHVVLIDIGVNVQHYHSDMTRVVYFGEPDRKILEIHAIVQKAQSAALQLCRPNTEIGELDRVARDLISEQGFGENFTHSLGHGVGLDIHEMPTIRNKPPHQAIPLQVGMVITIEPGIYLPGIGGVRIEDTVVITSQGHENLTNRSRDPVII